MAAFHGLREEKIGSENHKKPAVPLFPFSFFPCQLLQPLPQLPSPVRIPTNPVSTTVTPAAAATTLSNGFHPYQQQ